MKCPVCGKEYSFFHSGLGSYCSHECLKVAVKEIETLLNNELMNPIKEDKLIKCPICSKEYSFFHSEIGIYCSHECAEAAVKEIETLLESMEYEDSDKKDSLKVSQLNKRKIKKRVTEKLDKSRTIFRFEIHIWQRNTRQKHMFAIILCLLFICVRI